MNIKPAFHGGELVLRQHQNGGWTIEVHGQNPDIRALPAGAYTDEDDMIDGLRDILVNGCE
mgnify:CR=1 FL=1